MKMSANDALMNTYGTQKLVGLARWRAECAGEIAPPTELRVLRRRYGWTSRQISIAFEALAGVEVYPVNSFLLILEGELTSQERSALANEHVIRLDRDGWALTRKGEELLSLLNAYGDPRHQWSASPITFQ